VSNAAPIVLIYARARNGAIGQAGRLPWHIPADLKHFKALTLGKPMIMGRKTFESFPAPLPGRRHIVLTHDRSWAKPGAEPAYDVAQALALARRDNAQGEVAVVGGAHIYGLFMPLATRIELTQIDADYAGDTFMPAPSAEWQATATLTHAPEGKLPGYAFITLQRQL
jgi:dihydrofolate reductase